MLKERAKTSDCMTKSLYHTLYLTTHYPILKIAAPSCLRLAMTFKPKKASSRGSMTRQSAFLQMQKIASSSFLLLATTPPFIQHNIAIRITQYYILSTKIYTTY
ncbi:hypothetical protein DI53_3057 [Sphingobacterium deserti]|uniref:Uncharacterized protein n=1 Tax=Sphingobacterium deserti TaxID=1229276 RepID=A0A0B8SZV3_9SPHI|nr:hypothetical protein DI53_3057 [Sphingobacterium deserti]